MFKTTFSIAPALVQDGFGTVDAIETITLDVINDDYLSTVCSNQSNISQSWNKLFTFPSARMQVPLDEYDSPELADKWFTNEEATRYKIQGGWG